MFTYEQYVPQIRALRARGLTYSEIGAELGFYVPKGSLSYICRGVELPDSYAAKVRQLQQKNLEIQRVKALESNKRILTQRIDRIRQKAELFVHGADKYTQTIALAMLYWGEGAKYPRRRGLMLGNSDPKIVRLYIKLLDSCFAISRDELRARITYRADQDPVALRQYWSAQTKIPEDHFYRTIPDPRTAGSVTKNSDYMGVCVISCAGADLQLELQYIAEALEAQI